MCSPGRVRCGSSKLPANFCCLPTDTCWGLDNGSTALCCPKEENCASVGIMETVSCDLRLQDLTIYPTSPIMTSKLDAQLPTCGSQCCPFGSTCNNTSSKCVADVPSSFIANSTMLQGAPVSTGSPIGSIFDGCSPAKCSSFPGKAILAGFFPGVVGGVLWTLLALYCTRWVARTKTLAKRRDSESSTSSLSSLTFRTPQGDVIASNIDISGPMPVPDFSPSFRADFLRQSSNGGPCPSRVGSTMGMLRPKSLLIAPKPNSNSNMHYATLQPAFAQSPPSIYVTDPCPVVKRVPSAASISVYTRNEDEGEPGTRRTTRISSNMVERLVPRYSPVEPSYYHTRATRDADSLQVPFRRHVLK